MFAFPKHETLFKKIFKYNLYYNRTIINMIVTHIWLHTSSYKKYKIL